MDRNEDSISNIDIVIPWVDGNDLLWQKSRDIYSGNTENDNREERYRDWGTLKYLFRGIEKNTPWVRKVHFITCGHLPDWLNTENPKLNIVKHCDYIPSQWLPTFSANPIELNIHRIQGLSNKFIYMNDDTFYVKPLRPDDFFKNGKPKSQAGLEIISERDRIFTGILYSDLEVINRHFFSKHIMLKNLFRFVSFKYDLKSNFKSMAILPWCIGYFPGLPYFHGPNAYLKSTFEEVWELEEKVLE